MNLKCEYCGVMFDDTLEKCPNCGAVNKNVRRMAKGTPKTIEELQEWYHEHNLPPYEKTRFFLGVDYKNPRAFGIYRDGDEFIVYKNKDNGERAIRYRGPDEAYAVNELYLKLKGEILNQKEHNLGDQPTTASSVVKQTGSCFWGMIKGVGLFFLGLIALGSAVTCWYSVIPMVLPFVAYFLIAKFKPEWKDKVHRFLWPAVIILSFVTLYIFGVYEDKVYYNYNGETICKYENEYYRYDTYLGDYYYYSDSLPSGFSSSPSTYETEWDDSITKFEDSEYYDENFDSSDSNSSSYYSSGDSYSSWDSDYSWSSSDSWDSGSTDWGSDW